MSLCRACNAWRTCKRRGERDYINLERVVRPGDVRAAAGNAHIPGTDRSGGAKGGQTDQALRAGGAADVQQALRRGRADADVAARTGEDATGDLVERGGVQQQFA